MNTLKNQNLSLANRITALKREKADLSHSKNEFERKNIALETNVAILKQYWVKVRLVIYIELIYLLAFERAESYQRAPEAF